MSRELSNHRNEIGDVNDCLEKLSEARKMFGEMPERSVISWIAIINGYVSFSLEDEALRLFSEFLENGIVTNSRNYVCFY